MQMKEASEAVNGVNDRKQHAASDVDGGGRQDGVDADGDEASRRRGGTGATRTRGSARSFVPDSAALPSGSCRVHPSHTHPWSQPSLSPPHPQHPGTQPRPLLKEAPPSRARRFSILSGMFSDTDPLSGKCPHIAAIFSDESDRAALLSRYNTVVQWHAHRNHEVAYPAKRRKASTPA